jgi:hypothetical protein
MSALHGRYLRVFWMIDALHVLDEHYPSHVAEQIGLAKKD